MIVTTYEVYCDQCKTKCVEATVYNPYGARSAKQNARKQGWSCKGHDDLCPKCKVKEVK